MAADDTKSDLEQIPVVAQAEDDITLRASEPITSHISLDLNEMTIEDTPQEMKANPKLYKFGAFFQSQQSGEDDSIDIPDFVMPELKEEEKELLKLINIHSPEELMALSENVLVEKLQRIPVIKDRRKIRHLRIDIAMALEKTKEKKNAAIAKLEWQQKTNTFYQSARITKLHKDASGNIIGATIECDEELP
jgi:hypothetical protein